MLNNVDQRLMKNRQFDLLDRMTKKEPGNKYFHRFPHSDVTRNTSANNPQKSLKSFWLNYRLSIVIGLRSAVSGIRARSAVRRGERLKLSVESEKKWRPLRPLFMVPRSRSQMFLSFVLPPKDQDADVRFPNSVYGNDESTSV